MSWPRRFAIALALVLGTVVLFWLFVVDWLVVREVERRGSAAVGALVELDAADVSAFPPGIELLRLQVTNPSSPMENALEVRRIAGRMDGLALLRGRLIVDELDVEGVRIGTERSSSGAIDGVGEAAVPAAGFEIPSFDIPRVDEVLAGEELASLKQIESLRSEIDSFERRWKLRLDALPDQDAFESYRERLTEAVRDADLLTGVQELQTLRRDLKRDLDAVRSAGRDLESELAALRGRVDQARAAPLADFRRLRERYGLSSGGISNLSRRLFGESLNDVLQQILRWREPFQELLAGDSSAPDEEDATAPDFLIRVANLSVELDRVEIRGVVRNITANQPAFGQPMTFTFAAESIPGLERLGVEGLVDHRRPDEPADSFSLQLVGYDAAGALLSSRSEWPIRILRGRADAEVRLALGAADSLDATARLQLRDVELAAEFRAESALAAAIATALEGVTDLEISVSARGTTSDYRIEIASNADGILAQAVGGMVRRQSARFERALREEILGRTRVPLAELTQGESEVAALSGLLGARVRLGEEALDVKPKALKDQLKKLKLPF